MSDQIRSLTIVVLSFMLVFLGLVLFFNPTLIGSIGFGTLAFMVGYNWGKLEKFELN